MTCPRRLRASARPWAIEGMFDLIGKDGTGSAYACPNHAAKTREEMSRWIEKGGLALFSRRAAEIGSAGCAAPLRRPV